MIRRGPTRIALKIDDISEFEIVKKELEQERRERQQQAMNSTTEELAASSGDQADATPGSSWDGQPGGAVVAVADGARDLDPKARQERIQRRIGYDPRPAPSTSSRIGELRGGE